MTNDLDMGVVAEGLLWQDARGRFWIKGREDDKPHDWDVTEALTKYEGQKVRVVLVTFDTIDKIAKLVADGGLRIEEATVGKTG